jgi:hypothetical protein
MTVGFSGLGHGDHGVRGSEINTDRHCHPYLLLGL